MESGSGINGKSEKIVTIDGIIGGTYMPYPKFSLKGKYYNLIYFYLSHDVFVIMWLSMVVSNWLVQGEVTNHSKDITDFSDNDYPIGLDKKGHVTIM